MNNENECVFVTVTGLNHYYGAKPFVPGRIFRIVKEPDNRHDGEAIRAELPFIDTIGYVANSTSTVYIGTASAGRLYGMIDEYAYARVMFITHSSVIALVLSPDEVEQSDDSGEEPPQASTDPAASRDDNAEPESIPRTGSLPDYSTLRRGEKKHKIGF